MKWLGARNSHERMLKEGLRVFSTEKRRLRILQQHSKMYKCNKSVKNWFRTGTETKIHRDSLPTVLFTLNCWQKQSDRYIYVYIQVSVNIITKKYCLYISLLNEIALVTEPYSTMWKARQSSNENISSSGWYTCKAGSFSVPTLGFYEGYNIISKNKYISRRKARSWIFFILVKIFAKFIFSGT